MKNLEYILNLAFKRIPVKAVMEGKMDAASLKKAEFVKIAFVYMHEYSETELANMWTYYRDTFEDERRDYGRMLNSPADGINVFDALFYYVKRMLTIQNNEVLCKYCELLHWRNITFDLSEDLLVSAFYAQRFSKDKMSELGYNWKVVIGHNNAQLNGILRRGISENHFHLYGSSPVFHISWLSLMNNLTNSKSVEYLKSYDYERRNVNIHYGADYEEESFVIRYYQAALIRVFLYSVITGIKIEIGSYYVSCEKIRNYSIDEEFQTRLSGRKKIQLNQVKEYIQTDVYDELWKHITYENVCGMLRERLSLVGEIGVVQELIDTLRNPQMYTDVSLQNTLEDYALYTVGDDCRFDNGLFAGERWLLCQCLSEIYYNRFDYENLFYAYIKIKEEIRAELIQSNVNVGFVNFQKYQNRKTDLIDDAIFHSAVVKKAVEEILFSDSMLALELRITPYDTAEKNRKMIQNLDRIIGKKRNRYFYTLHFIKAQDERDYSNGAVLCRHYQIRKKIKKTAGAIIGLREKYPAYARRILGIDAASNEIGCRPEVFGSVFRYLRNHVKADEDDLRSEKVPQLHVTYHVGEDFVDILDGLRAIDEAINFLNMDCGDRIGHGLALGLDVEEWYHSKNNRILISQQDYLDNLVWMYNRLIQFDIDGMDNLKDYIEKKYSAYFYEVYGKYLDLDSIGKIMTKVQRIYSSHNIPCAFYNDHYQFDIFQYYNAWKIRGDDPDLYSQGYFMWTEDGTEQTNSSVNMKFPKEFKVRYIPEVFLLNYYYHFNNEVRRAGNKRIEVEIKPFYIRGVKMIQKEMQRRIGRRGIAIETNPSSNYLISTFKDYKKHPIFNLYNKELALNTDDLNYCPQLCVSINTDDMGVFSTSLENEYALLACALEQAVDENGEYLYNKSKVYDWIDSVRKMGNEQSFLSRNNRKGLYLKE